MSIPQSLISTSYETRRILTPSPLQNIAASVYILQIRDLSIAFCFLYILPSHNTSFSDILALLLSTSPPYIICGNSTALRPTQDLTSNKDFERCRPSPVFLQRLNPPQSPNHANSFELNLWNYLDN